MDLLIIHRRFVFRGIYFITIVSPVFVIYIAMAVVTTIPTQSKSTINVEYKLDRERQGTCP